MGRVINLLFFLILLIWPVAIYSQTGSFLSFDVRPGDNRKILIQWNVNPAGDTLSFEVQKSSDQKNWKVIAIITPRLTHQYSYTDTSQDGVLYFRARQISTVPGFLYTQIRWVQVNQTRKLYIWPNPAKDVLHLKTSFNNGSIDVVDPEGKHIFKIVITDFVTDISTVRLAKGIYFLQIKHNKEIWIEKFIKE